MLYRDVEKRKKLVRNFICTTPQATYKDLRRIGIKIDKVYQDGMEEAFKDAGVNPPRNFRIKTKEEKRNIVIAYIQKYPNARGQQIRKDTKIDFLSLFKNTKEAFEKAGIVYWKEQKKNDLSSIIKLNPLISIEELSKKLKMNPYNYYKNIEEIYHKAGIHYITRSQKRRIKKQEKVVEFIRQNQFATQRELNRVCKTHVQEIFEKGIFEAYQRAKVPFPFERLKLYGAAIKDIKERAKKYEAQISLKLSKYGKVNRLVKTKRGIVDILFERGEHKLVIEIKDYEAKEISISQVKQLYRYLEDCNRTFGIIICKKKPKKDSFVFSGKLIIILQDNEINRIPQIILNTNRFIKRNFQT